MPGDHGYDNEEKERKQRIKKMKAKTSKMRLAVFDFQKKTKKPSIINSIREPGRQYTIGDSDYETIWNNHYEYPNEDFEASHILTEHDGNKININPEISALDNKKYFGMDSGQRNKYNSFPERIKGIINQRINENTSGGEYDSYFDERDMSNKERAKLPFKQKGEYT